MVDYALISGAATVGLGTVVSRGSSGVMDRAAALRDGAGPNWSFVGKAAYYRNRTPNPAY
ncbi:MAG TPA: hypothetical protein VGM32_07945 [Rhodopila sp.]